MKRIFVCTLSLALFASLSLAAQSAPSGSYQKTCKDIKFANNNLTATCQKGNGGGYAAPSTLPDAAGCVGDIGNVFGTLVCTGAVGSYYLTCKDSRVDGSTLSATCKKKDGTWVPSSLANFQGFHGNINNCDGQLRNGPC
jgi:CVNH domain-containing protein